jgi:hypothetical protein
MFNPIERYRKFREGCPDFILYVSGALLVVVIIIVSILL